jgi:hypothetical protein
MRACASWPRTSYRTYVPGRNARRGERHVQVRYRVPRALPSTGYHTVSPLGTTHYALCSERQTEAEIAWQRLTGTLSRKWATAYSKICFYVKVARAMSRCLQGARQSLYQLLPTRPTSFRFFHEFNNQSPRTTHVPPSLLTPHSPSIHTLPHNLAKLVAQ